MFLAIGCLDVPGGGGGEGEGVHRGGGGQMDREGEGVGNIEVGGNSAVGAIVGGGGGGQQLGCLQPLRTTLHTISISLQNSLS